jgi:hypothetical protein
LLQPQKLRLQKYELFSFRAIPKKDENADIAFSLFLGIACKGYFV